MNLLAAEGDGGTPPPSPAAEAPALPELHPESSEPDSDASEESSSEPEDDDDRLQGYRLVDLNSPSGDVRFAPCKEKTSRSESAVLPRLHILDLLRPDDPGREAIEAIVRSRSSRIPSKDDAEDYSSGNSWNYRGSSASPTMWCASRGSYEPESDDERDAAPASLADELHAAESGSKPLAKERRVVGRHEERARSSAERERLARMALAVEEDESVPAVKAVECGLAAAARQLDLMLAESRDLHEELAEIHDDMKAETRRAAWCAAAARALLADTRALRFLDDVLALLRGDMATALRARAWPFAFGTARDAGHNYIV